MVAVDVLCGNTILPFYIVGAGIVLSFCLRIFILYEYWIPLVSFIVKCVCCNCCCKKCCKYCKKKKKHEQLPKAIKIGFALSEGRKNAIELSIACNYKLINDTYYESTDSLNTFNEKVVIYHDNRAEFNCWAITYQSLQEKINIAKGFSDQANINNIIDKLYDSKWKMGRSQWNKIGQNELLQRKSNTPYYEIMHEQHIQNIMKRIREEEKLQTERTNDINADFNVSTISKEEIFAEHKELEVIDQKLQSYHQQGINEYVELYVKKCPVLRFLGNNAVIELNQDSKSRDFIHSDIAYFDKIIEKYDEYKHWTTLQNRVIRMNLVRGGLITDDYSIPDLLNSPLYKLRPPSHYEYTKSEFDLKLKIYFYGWSNYLMTENIPVSGLLFFDSGESGDKLAEDCNEQLSIAKCIDNQWFINTQTWNGKNIDVSLYKNRNYKGITKKYVLFMYILTLFVLSIYQWYLDIVDMSNKMNKLDSGWKKYQCMNLILLNSPNIKTFIITMALIPCRRNLIKLKKYPLWLNVILIGEKGLIIVVLICCFFTHCFPGLFVFGIVLLAAIFVPIFIVIVIGSLIKSYFKKKLEMEQQMAIIIQSELDAIKNNDDFEEIAFGLYFTVLFAVFYFYVLSVVLMMTKLYSGKGWVTSWVENFTERKTEHFMNDFEENFTTNKDRLFEFIFRFI